MIRHIILMVLIYMGLSAEAQSQEKYDIYYFAVGSGHYEKDRRALEKGYYGLPDVKGATESARYVAALFDDLGAAGGEVLVSEDFKFISRKNLFDGLNKALANAKNLKKDKLLFVFYYCGHGFTNGELQAMFVPPGDLARDPSKFTYEEWLDNTISPVEIREKLEDAGLRYMIIMDCCYEGENRTVEALNPQLVQLLGLEEMDELMKNSYEMIVAMNQMRGPDPTLFSTLSGESVQLVDYDFENERREIGPLCYRMYKTIYESLKGQPFTLSDFMIMMQQGEWDNNTRKAVSYWTMEDNAWLYLKK